MLTSPSARPRQVHAAARAAATPADLFDATWLASLAAARRRVVLLIGAGLFLLAVGGALVSAAHAASGGFAEAWPRCLAGVTVVLAGVAALGAVGRAARDLG